MPTFDSRGMGWQRDLKDARDYQPNHAAIRNRLRDLARFRHGTQRLPSSVDLREYLPAARDQGQLNSASAFAALATIEYFEARTAGRALDASPLFLYQIALKLLRLTQNANVNLRSVFKALVRFGAPPEYYWPYDTEHLALVPTDAFLFSFSREYETTRYFRLDSTDGQQTLRVVRSFLAAGFAIAFGFCVPSSLSNDADIGFRPQFDSLRGGQAALAVGYDDSRRIASETGALLIRSSWGTQWGEQGYGWLPYAFVTHQFAVDFWTALRADWFASGVLSQPTMDF